MSESYPFLAIARKYSVDYGLVLSYADLAMDSKGNAFWQNQSTHLLPLLVRQEICTEADKQSLIKAGRHV